MIKAQDTRNPLIIELIYDYWTFKERLVKSRPRTIEYESEIETIRNSKEKQKTVMCFLNEKKLLEDFREN